MKPPSKSNIDTWKENVCTDKLMIGFPHWRPYSVRAVSVRMNLVLPFPKRQHATFGIWSCLQTRDLSNSTHSMTATLHVASHCTLTTYFHLARIWSLIPCLHTHTPCYHCKASVEWLNSFLPWFPVNAFVFLHMLVTTFIAKRTSCCPPEMAFISIHRTRELRLIHTGTREQWMKTAC
jgi:hypothetical protein